MQHPDQRLKDPCLRFWLARKNWSISPPYAQWYYWHIIKGDGGVLPLNVDILLAFYHNDPLATDDLARDHRLAVFQHNYKISK
jgi:hypothetical protein